MWIALVRKEARESVGILAAAAGLYFFLVAEFVNFPLLPEIVRYHAGFSHWGRWPIPFLGGNFTLLFAVISGVFAFVLGLWQTVGESRRGTFPLLLHLPLARSRIIGAKLASGLALYFVSAAVPILFYAWWAATPGTHASPFDWSMTTEAWQLWFGMSAIYLGSFLSGVRPARWVGTRLFPLLGSAALVVMFSGLQALFGLPWFAYLVAAFCLDVVLVTLILYVAAARDFS